ncbi:YdiU family protein [Leptospira kanakyensis]|uniref:Protein nucleotidyltransferase YdiU n=1 Tax=Leptospira kanakyensis TaxID=2484968 RepID=A0A6N4QDE8_9LEPT|nr:YdiU family protein [Leptospira kanakyensis]TGK50749.1 YdiU family protein [Leptospira kanakyensis]TGK63650.1 YdiU family protein [Leptospira kanakyensis]TGK69886.1 YdiU family protein [Leptospira kanakyensis]
MSSFSFPSYPTIESTYTSLPDSFFQYTKPTPVSSPKVLFWNDELAYDFHFSEWAKDKDALAQFFSGSTLREGLNPFAQAYAGHQFGHFTMLGDGRAILIGEILNRSGERFDFQWKGSGRTRYSRNGDGRATVSAMAREYIMSEATFGLQIPTTRSLAVVTTGEPVLREEIQTGAVLTRVAKSHIRVGTFEYAYQALPLNELEVLFRYTAERHAPDVLKQNNPALNFLEFVMKRQVDLVTNWMRVGFIHGVMNTDNMSISGETIDYGPCAFMNGFSAKRVFSSIDVNGRYAYTNQVGIAQWNLGCLANSLLPLIDPNKEKAIELAKAKMSELETWFQESYIRMLGEKIGIPHLTEKDLPLLQNLYQWMQDSEADFTNTFLVLEGVHSPKDSIYNDVRWKDWMKTWQEEKTKKGIRDEDAIALMQKTNPSLIPRNHLVESALTNASQGLTSIAEQLITRSKSPYQRDIGYDYTTEVPMGGDHNYQTFCGT